MKRSRDNRGGSKTNETDTDANDVSETSYTNVSIRPMYRYTFSIRSWSWLGHLHIAE